MGVSVYLGRTDNDLCPVAASLDFMVCRGTTAGPFFTFSDGSYLTRERFVQAVRSDLDQIGLVSSNYADHSFRSGAVTTAAQRSIQDVLSWLLGEFSIYFACQNSSRDSLFCDRCIGVMTLTTIITLYFNSINTNIYILGFGEG